MKSHVELLARYAVLLSELSIVKQGLYDWFSSLSLEEKLKVFLVDTVPLDEILKKEPYILNFKKENLGNEDLIVIILNLQKDIKMFQSMISIKIFIIIMKTMMGKLSGKTHYMSICLIYLSMKK